MSARSQARLPAVLVGGGIIPISVGRCLGPSGIPVWTLGDAATDSTMYSRYCTRFVDLGGGDGLQERWIEWLRSCPVGEAVVLPCSDDGLELVCRHRAELVALGYRPIEADDDVALAMLDKLETYRRARLAGIDTPRHFELQGLERLDEDMAASGVRFPCALKPLHSHVFRRHIPHKALIVHSGAELADAAREVERRQLKVMVTEIVPGSEASYVAFHGFFDEAGRPLAQLTKRKLRQYPVGFGMGTYHVTDWNPEVLEAGLKFCQGVGIRGVGNPEFKRDPRDGRLKLMECNHRFSMVNELLRRAGMNTPLLAYNRLVGEPAVPMDGYRRGVRLWYPAEDFRAFRAARRSGDLTFVRWAASLLHPQHLATFELHDPGPALWNWSERALRLAGVRRANSE